MPLGSVGSCRRGRASIRAERLAFGQDSAERAVRSHARSDPSSLAGLAVITFPQPGLRALGGGAAVAVRKDMRQVTDEERAEITCLRGEGRGRDETAEMIGRAQRTVSMDCAEC